MCVALHEANGGQEVLAACFPPLQRKRHSWKLLVSLHAPVEERGGQNQRQQQTHNSSYYELKSPLVIHQAQMQGLAITNPLTVIAASSQCFTWSQKQQKRKNHSHDSIFNQ